MVTYYYAMVDNNGMLCVDQFGEHAVGAPQNATEEDVRQVADAYPDVIYFAVEHD